MVLCPILRKISQFAAINLVFMFCFDIAALATSAEDFTDAAQLLAQGREGRRQKRENRRRTIAPKAATQSDSEAPKASGATEGTSSVAPDEPYQWEIALLSDFFSRSQTQGEQKSGDGNYELTLRALYLYSPSFAVGPDLSYVDRTSKYETDLRSDQVVNNRAYNFTLLGKYIFGDLNRDQGLFYAFLGIGYVGGGNSTDGEDDISLSGSRIVAGGGFHYFVDSNVAGSAEIEYTTGTLKSDAEGAKPIQYTELHVMRIGMNLFL